jgi:tetratricopeptide (TPR) repeat protein
MARKRLNKKVLFIGAGLLLILAVGIIGVILYLSRDPEKFIKDGEAAVKAARQATDEETRLEKYDQAARNFNRARARMDNDEDRVKILYRLADIFVKTNQWNKVRGCWNKITRVDPDSFPARFSQLEYLYIMANDGASGAWKEVDSQATDFLKVSEPNMAISDMYTSKLIREKLQAEDELSNRVESVNGYLYLVRGRARLEMAELGSTTDPNQLLTTAVSDLEKAGEIEPGNMDIYQYLARAERLRGQLRASRGFSGTREESFQRSLELLQKAVEENPDNPRAHINLLNMKFDNIRSQDAAQEKLLALENEYLKLADDFPSSEEVYFAICRYYASLGYEHFDPAIQAVNKALELAPKNVTYAITAANLQYRKYSVFRRSDNNYNSGISKAVKIAENALTYPGAEQEEGPGYYRRRQNKMLLCDLLAKCYTEQIIEPVKQLTEQQKQDLINKAEDTIYQLEQLFGSGDQPHIIKWKGILALAKGNTQAGIRQLDSVYEDYKASGRRDPYLSYRLAEAVRGTGEIGAVREFLNSAISRSEQGNGIISEKPYVLIDYAQLFYQMEAYSQSLNLVNVFEENFWSNAQTRNLRISSLIASNQIDEAEKELNKLPSDKQDIINLKINLVSKQIEQLRNTVRQEQFENNSTQAGRLTSQSSESPLSNEQINEDLKQRYAKLDDLLRELLNREPESINLAALLSVARYNLRNENISNAEALIQEYLKHFPDDIDVKIFMKRLEYPDPLDVPEDELADYRLELLEEIDDKTTRALSLGIFYLSRGDAEKSKQYLNTVLQQEPVEQPDVTEDIEKVNVKGSKSIAASYLLDIAVDQNDFSLAENVVDAARTDNLDGCNGNFFAARLLMGRDEYDSALQRINKALEIRPIFGRGYMLRSRINSVLGNNDSALDDIEQASSLRPTDARIARQRALMLYQRNERLGDSVTRAQVSETRRALLRAIRLNPGQGNLQSLYAQYISDQDPENSLAILQRIQQSSPTVQNSLLLARQAMELSEQTNQQDRKDFLIELAGSVLEQAKQADPNSEAVMDAYAEYYRTTGQPEKAEQMLQGSKSDSVLWRHYFNLGRMEKAKEVLERLYTRKPNDRDTLNGLIQVAVSTQDKQAVEKYTQKYVELEDTAQTRLVQVQAMVNTGLLQQAENKLQELKEKYPDQSKAVLLEAYIALKRGEFEKARDLSNRVLEMDENSNIAWRLRGTVNTLLGNYDKAISDLRQSKTISSEPQTRLELAKAYLNAERYEDAITELESLISSSQAGQAVVEARRILERVYSRLDRRRALQTFYEETIKKLPGNVYWFNQAGNLALSQQQYSQAREYFKRAIENSSADGNLDSSALNGYLQTFLAESEYNQLFEEARKYTDTNLGYLAFYKMAQAKVAADDKTAAVDYFRNAISKTSDNQDIVVSILRSMYNSLGEEQVRTICENMLEQNPESSAANFVMFNLARINDRYNKALDYINKCIEITPSDSNRKTFYRMQKVNVLQASYDKTENREYLNQAVNLYKSMLNKMPNNVIVLNNLAYLLAENGLELEKAVEYSEKVYQQMPDNPNFLDTYAYVLYKNENYEKAEQIIQAAVQNTEQEHTQFSYEIYEHMGMIKEKLNKPEQAKQAYQRAVETVKASDRANKDEIEKRLELAISRL